MKDLIRNIRSSILRRRASSHPELTLQSSTVILAPHPDDETIGCGGLITRLCNEGNPPYVIIMTGGGGSLDGHAEIKEEEIIKARRQLTLNSAKELGLPESNIHFLDFKDGSIGKRSQLEMDRLRELIEDLKPDNILVPHSGEGWPDHLTVREIGMQIAKECSYGSPNVIEYCVWMWYYNVWNLDWQNSRKVKLTPAERKAKLRAVNEYILPLSPNGTPWSGILPKPFIKANTSKTELYFLQTAE